MVVVMNAVVIAVVMEVVEVEAETEMVMVALKSCHIWDVFGRLKQ